MNRGLGDIVASDHLVLLPVNNVEIPARSWEWITIVQLEAAGQTSSWHVLLGGHVG